MPSSATPIRIVPPRLLEKATNSAATPAVDHGNWTWHGSSTRWKVAITLRVMIANKNDDGRDREHPPPTSQARLRGAGGSRGEPRDGRAAVAGHAVHPGGVRTGRQQSAAGEDQTSPGKPFRLVHRRSSGFRTRPHAVRGSPDPAQASTEGLPQRHPFGDLRSAVSAGSGDSRRARMKASPCHLIPAARLQQYRREQLDTVASSRYAVAVTSFCSVTPAWPNSLADRRGGTAR